MLTNNNHTSVYGFNNNVARVAYQNNEQPEKSPVKEEVNNDFGSSP